MRLSVRLRHAFPGFSLDAAFDAPAGITVLFGRSGSGKSTIVNALAGLLRPDDGRIVVDGRVLLDVEAGAFLAPHRRGLGVIFQEGRLFPHLTVRQNILFGRWFSKARTSDGATEPSPARVVSLLGLEGLLQRRPGTLSGGERQRVAIGRALLARPRLILADEPLASLDDARKSEILPYLERLRDEVSVPILYVSHSAAEVARLATTVVALEAGRVVRVGPASAVLSDPMVTPTGIRAVGAVLRATVAAHHDDGLTEVAAGNVRLFLPRIASPPGVPVRVRVAAHDVMLARVAPEGLSALNVLAGTVETVRSGEGPGALVSVRTDAGALLARVTQRSALALSLAPGVPCHAIIKSVAIAPEDVGLGDGVDPSPIGH